MRIFVLLICLAIIPLHSWSQSHSAETFEENCGTEVRHAHLMRTDEAYKARFLRQKALLDSIKYAPKAPSRQLDSVMTIPIVVHVIHLGERIGSQSNISDQQIYGAIAGLNERFANANGLGNDIMINFCLATRDPNGCPTSGINRVDGSVIPGYREEGITWDHECGVEEEPLKDLSKWPTWEYYNVWVVHDICGSIAGYAYYPNGNEYDGTVIDIASMRYENGTLAHELGHGLNLRHTFSGEEDGNCPVNDDCMEDGDEVCDTPPHTRNACAHFNPCTTEGNWLNSKNNWMSYCFPNASVGLFTADQRTRVWDAMSVEPRSALLSSQGCANAQSMMITSNADILCPHESRVVAAQPPGGYFRIADGSGFIQDSVLTPTGGSNILLEYVIEQSTCTSSVFQEIPVRVVPQALIRTAQDTLCAGQATTLQGFPSGGAFSVVSGPAQIDSNLQLISEGSGEISLIYEKLFSGCIVRDSHTVMSFDYPVAEIEALSDDVLTAVPDTGSFQWLRCDNNYEAVADGVNAILQVTSSGSYAVISSNGNCRDTSDCVLVTVTATHDESGEKLLLYPNPVNEVFYLEGFQWEDYSDLTITDMRGVQLTPNIIHEGNRMKIDASSLPGGVYVLRVNIGAVGYIVKRVMVKGR